jgi:hypothetical protein
MYDWTRAWISLRAQHSALRRGQLIDLFYDNDTYVFARQDKTETVIIAINRVDKKREITISAAAIGLRDGSEMISAIGDSIRARIANGQTTVALPMKSVVAFTVR